MKLNRLRITKSLSPCYSYSALALLLLWGSVSLSHAVSWPMAQSTDQRVRTINYNENDVYEITAAYGVTTTVEFAADEVVQTAAFGDAAAWQFVDIGNAFSIKPVAINADSNLTVWTNKHLYLFHLSVLAPDIDGAGTIQKPSREADLTYLLRFRYPSSPHHLLGASSLGKNNIDAEEPNCSNYHYSRYGEWRIAPSLVCDDGQFTYFLFERYQDQPAIFLVDNKRREHVINTRQVGNYQVVERLGRQFSLRYGDTVTTVFNEQSHRG